MRAPHLQVCSSHMHASCPLRHSKLVPILHACSCCCFQHFCQTSQDPEGHHQVLLENSTSQLPVPAAASALCASATGTVLLMSLLLLLLLVVALVVDGCNQGHAARRPQPGGNLLEPGRGGDLKQAGAPGAPTVAAAAAWGSWSGGKGGERRVWPCCSSFCVDRHSDALQRASTCSRRCPLREALACTIASSFLRCRCRTASPSPPPPGHAWSRRCHARRVIGRWRTPSPAILPHPDCLTAFSIAFQAFSSRYLAAGWSCLAGLGHARSRRLRQGRCW